MREAAGPPRGLRRNTAAGLASRIVSVVAWVAVTPWVLRGFGEERFGVWALFLLAGGWVVALDLGIGSGIARFVGLGVARGEGVEVRRIVGRATALTLALGLAWAAALVLARGPLLDAFHVPTGLRDETARAAWWVAASLPVGFVAALMQGTLAGLQRLDLSNLVFLAGLAVHLVGLSLALSLGGGLVGAGMAMAAGQLTTALAGAALARAGITALPRRASSAPLGWRALAGFGAAVQVTNVLILAQLHAGRLMLGALGTLAWVSHYELGFRLANAVWSVPVLVQAAAIPAAAHASGTDGAAAAATSLRSVYDWCCRWEFALSGLALGALWIAGPSIARAWLGDAVPEAGAVARGLAVAFGVAILFGPAASVARGAGWPWLEAAAYAAALATQVATALWLVPVRGVDGAVQAAALSFVAGAAVVLPMLHRRLGIGTGRWLLERVLPRAGAAVVAVLAVQLAWPPAPAAARLDAALEAVRVAALFATLYVALLWPTGDPRAVLQRTAGWLAARRLGREAA